jgi:hypothetical protein
MKYRLGIAIFALLPVALCAAQSATGPTIPAEEDFVYARTIGATRDGIETRSRLVTDKGESWFELTSHSAEQDLVLRLDPATLLANYTEVTSRGKGATLRRETTILDNRTPPAPDKIVVAGMDSLPYTLRAFPWGSLQKATIVFLGTSAAGNFRFDLSVTGKETLAVGDKGVECWKTQLSLSGILGAFFGKSYLWYSTDYPHYLVRSEGPSAGPGSPTSILTLVSYSTRAASQ